MSGMKEARARLAAMSKRHLLDLLCRENSEFSRVKLNRLTRDALVEQYGARLLRQLTER